MTNEVSQDGIAEGKSEGQISTLLALQRTTLSFQRTRLSADRTLMSVIRTALSLIGFGFSIFQFFHSLKNIVELKKDPSVTAGRLGLTLVAMGIGMLILGITYQIIFMLQVRKERQNLMKQGLLIPQDTFPVSMTLITAVLLLLLGIFVIFKMIIYPGT